MTTSVDAGQPTRIPFFRNPRRVIPLLVVIALLVFSVFLPRPELHVSLAPEKIWYGGPDWLTNTWITTIVVDLILILGALVVRAGLRRAERQQTAPTGFTNVMEFMVEGLYNLLKGVAGKHTNRFFPWVTTIFFLVIVSNYVGLLPGVNTIQSPWSVPPADHAQVSSQDLVANPQDSRTFALFAATADEDHTSTKPLLRAPSTDLNMTFALALITMIMVQYFGLRDLGPRYLRKFFAFRKGGMGMLMGVVGLLELVGEFAKIISFSFRLFGNIFAGEVLLAVMAFLIPFVVPSLFYGFEVFVGFIQAAVFMMLAVILFTTATVSHDDHH